MWNRRLTIGAGLLLASACLTATVPAWAADSRDQVAVRHLLMQTFDKPESRLQVEAIAVQAEHAVASWAQGERGGRALLRRQGQAWQIVLCAGDGLKQAAGLREAGLKPADAQALAGRLAQVEARLTPAQRERYGRFEGQVRMDAQGAHPPQSHGHGHGH